MSFAKLVWVASVESPPRVVLQQVYPDILSVMASEVEPGSPTCAVVAHVGVVEPL